MANVPQQDNRPYAYAPNSQNDERWKELCAQAAMEQDPQRLIELIQEINRMLEGPASASVLIPRRLNL
jgi:hypothetical protein